MLGGLGGDWEESAVGPVESCTQPGAAKERKARRALPDLCCVSSHSKDYGRRYRFSRGRGHGWTLGSGEKRIQLIIIPGSHSLVVHVWMNARRYICAPLSDHPLYQQHDSSLLCEDVGPQPASCLRSRPASSRRSQQTGRAG